MLRRELTPGTPPPRLRFRGPNVHVPLWALAGGWLLAVAVRGLVAAVRWWRVSVPAVLGWSLWLRWGVVLLWGVLALGVLLAGWAWRWPASFRTQVADRVLSRWRWLWVYRRDWQPAMVTTGLAFRPQLGASLPRLRWVRSTSSTDVVRVRMLPGQTVDDWREQAARLAQVFGARSVRVQRDLAQLQDLLLIVRRRAGTKIEKLEVSSVTELHADAPTAPVPPATSPFPRAPRGVR